MKLVIYSVAEKTPPLEESVILWGMDGGQINRMGFDRAVLSIPDKNYIVGADEHPSMVWEKKQMRLSDRWSYVTPESGG